MERRLCRESSRLSSSGSCRAEWRWSGDVSESRSKQDSGSSCGLSRSDSMEAWWRCHPLPGQVAVEPTETSSGRTAQGAMENSPVNKSSTGETEIRLGSVMCTDRDFAIPCKTASSF